MAQTKKTSSSRGNGASVTRASAAKNTQAKQSTRNSSKSASQTGRFADKGMPYVLAVAAILVAVCVIFGEGWFGEAVKNVLTGIFSGAAYVIPVILLLRVILWKRDTEEGLRTSRSVCLTFVFLIITMLLHVLGDGAESFSISEHYENGRNFVGGGVVGGVFGQMINGSVGKTGALIIMFTAGVLLALYVGGLTPRGIFIRIAYGLKYSKENREQRRAENEERRRENYSMGKKREEEYLEYLREKRRRAAEEDPLGEDDEYNIPEQKLNTVEPEVYHIKKKGKRKKNDPLGDEREHIANSLGEMMSDDFSGIEEYNTEKQITLEEQPENDGLPEDTDTELSEEEANEKLYDEVMRRTRERIEKSRAKDGSTDEISANDAIDAVSVAAAIVRGQNGAGAASESKDFCTEDLFVNPEDAALIEKLSETYGAPLEVKRTTVSAPVEVKKEPEKPAVQEYKFPPIDILAADPGISDGGIKEELQENAYKLVETLRSFNVKTKIENISRGPTITRYELLPEPGTRVRSIVNLVDDISLNLATTGVRIEAPIPGKSAVGIEVPNKKQSTVHLRTLIEDSQFKEAKSKLTVCLGQNVAGESVYFDIAKMPHMLIAGATGSGKSVCINSIITSILYKASPEDVKLILIDPKKVELNIYNGIPHLLVPVVSEPKKAAGSLSWAVSEMERRFGLIEAVGVRDIKNYNKVTENDPGYEYLPRIVIIIDELADLMMTAPDDVEESICRIAQKARAAGMHLIIGTQRPSVDVITGLIKANIPSRIAFRTSSQIDSRTIIDIGSAANLIGSGDMLFNPVGALKPTRVQGAYVSEADVEEVVSYIKEMNSGSSNYSDEIANQIEREAQRCGVKKGMQSELADDDGEGDEDPMLKNAIELAIESGKISTSLIQRRLSLGYGRAAKLIDRMEQLGYVSAPDGQKPREVMITKEEYMEMRLKEETPFE